MSEKITNKGNSEFIGEFLALIDKYSLEMVNKDAEIGCEHYADKLNSDALAYASAMYIAHILRMGTATQEEINLYLKKALARVSHLAMYLEFDTGSRKNGGGER